MKTVTADFLAARALFQPPAAIKNIVLSEHELDGTLLNEYDLSSRLKGGLPIIDREIEKELNEFITGEMTLKFHDPDKYIENILTQSNRMFGLKAKETFKTLDMIQADSVSLGLNYERCAFSPNGKYLFTSNDDGASSVIRRYSINGDTGEATLEKEVTPLAYHGYHFVVTANYLYQIYTNGLLKIFDYDLNFIGECGSGVNQKLRKIYISLDENHAWASSYANYGTIYYDISDKINPVKIGMAAPYSSYECLYFDNKLFVLNYTTRYLEWYDASIPANVPYAFIDSLYLDSYCDHTIFDRERAILYVFGLFTSSTHAIDLSNPNSPTITATKDEQGYRPTATGRGCKIGDKLFINNADDDKIYIIDTGNHYQLKSFDSFDITPAENVRDVAYNGSNIVAWIGRDAVGANWQSTLYTVKLRQDWLPLFDGKVQSTHRKGRNTRIVSAQTWEKESEQHNAELVFDNENIPFRNICGVIITKVSGGQPGAKNIKYEYKETDTDILYELRYENGPPKLFEAGENQLFDLYNEKGNQYIRGYFSSSLALKVNAEDTFLVGENLSIDNIGYWYTAIAVSDLIPKLFDRSTIEIINETIDVNEETGTLDKEQFLYFHKTYFGAAEYLHGVGAVAQFINRTVSHGNVFVAREGVYNYTWDKSILSFTKTFKFNCTDYLADTIFVEKILYDESGNKFLVCVSHVTKLPIAGEREYHCCCGVIKTDADGNYIEHWDDGDLANSGYNWAIGHRFLLAKSFTWCVRETTPLCDRNRLGFLALYENAFVPGLIDGALGVIFNVSTGSWEDDLQVDTTEGWEFGQGAVVAWDYTNSRVGLVYGVYFNTSDNKAYAFQQDNGGLHTKELVNLKFEEDIYGQFQYNYYTDLGGFTRYALYSKPKDDEDEKQIFLVWNGFEMYPTETINRFFACSHIETKYPVTILNYYPMGAYGWGLDADGNQESIVGVIMPVSGELPEIETLQTGFLGSEYKVSGTPYKSSDGWIGIATAGYSTTLVVFTVTNVGKNIIQIADFTDFNVREAINKIAEVAICYWKRPERDTAKFISRGNTVGTFTLENSEYKKDYVIHNSKAYIGVEVKNDLHPEYTYRYPDTFNDEEGEVLKIENRFIFPINGYVVAKTLGDWFMQIRKESTVEGFFLMELEELDKIEFKLYNVDGSPDIQIDSILVKASFDDNTKKVILTMIELEGYPFKAIRFRPDYFAG